MSDTNSHFSLSANALFQKVVDETVILDSTSGQYFTLDPIATQMVELLQSGKSVQQTVDSIYAEYDSDPNIILKDLQELTEQMQSKGLLVKQA